VATWYGSKSAASALPRSVLRGAASLSCRRLSLRRKTFRIATSLSLPPLPHHLGTMPSPRLRTAYLHCSAIPPISLAYLLRCNALLSLTSDLSSLSLQRLTYTALPPLLLPPLSRHDTVTMLQNYRYLLFFSTFFLLLLTPHFAVPQNILYQALPRCMRSLPTR